MKPPQFEIPFANASFRLEQQTTLDGERITREAAQTEADRAASNALQTDFMDAPNPQSAIPNPQSEDESHTDIWREAQTKYDAGDRSWTATNEATYWYFLEVLPPLMTLGAFAPSEAWKDDREGRPLYLWFRKFNSQHEARIASRQEMNHA